MSPLFAQTHVPCTSTWINVEYFISFIIDGVIINLYHTYFHLHKNTLNFISILIIHIILHVHLHHLLFYQYKILQEVLAHNGRK